MTMPGPLLLREARNVIPQTSPTPVLQIDAVLIVDDSNVQRLHCAALCREFGVQTVYEASNGREALALLSTLSPPPSVMLVDLEMPTMDGPELLEELQHLGVTIPIIVLSSRERILLDSVLDMGKAMGLRVLAAVQKPLRADTLQGALANLPNAMAERRSTTRMDIDVSTLRDAINNNEMFVHYQPKVDVKTGILRGVEALARWKHPELGMVPPDQFIPLAERHDLIHPLTLQIMNTAMLQTSAWHARGLHISVALNLSPLLLERSDLAREIFSLSQSHGLPAEQIILEVTESSLVSQIGVALGVLARLRIKGFGLSIDDYGTGFSSLQQLARIPFTELKIDRSFVHHAPERESLQVILRSALDLANRLGLVAVAEGVETLEEWRMLQEFGCTMGQGWLIAKAMPAIEIGPWLRTHRSQRDALRARDLEPAPATEVQDLDQD
jgi:EAL domain-containing protein (putative c-di-GMP-specific phosphodiesterase class I)/ActR/RegA family two-component response regulator